MAKKIDIKFTEHFEADLKDIKRYLLEIDASNAFDHLLDELLDKVIPTLERFPELGRPFFERPICSVEAGNAMAALQNKLMTLTSELQAVREYVLKKHLLLYALIDGTIYLLTIKHQRQLSFDLEGLWIEK